MVIIKQKFVILTVVCNLEKKNVISAISSHYIPYLPIMNFKFWSKWICVVLQPNEKQMMSVAFINMSITAEQLRTDITLTEKCDTLFTIKQKLLYLQRVLGMR